MNSKKILATLSLVLFFVLLQQMSFAQTDFNYSTATGTGVFNVTLPPINSNPVSTPPYYSLFIETGNGRYFKIPGNLGGTVYPTIDGTVSTTNSYPYPFKIDANSKAFATVSGWYDTTRRPPREVAFAAQNPGGTMLSNQTNLSNKARIGIDPCVNVIVPGDTMTFALTYKPYNVSGSNSLVTFYYNKTYDGGNIFGEINDQTTNFFYNPGQETPDAVKAIRSVIQVAGNLIQVPVYTSIPTTLPQSVQQSLGTAFAGSGYSKALYFLIPSNFDQTEKNIFLTLVPTKNISSYNPAPTPGVSTSTQVLAGIYRYDNNGVMDPQNIPFTLGINLLARDPNGITVSPQCLENPFGSNPYNRPIPITLNFKNTGGAPARDVITTVTIPDGIQIPANLPDAYLRLHGFTLQLRAFTPGARKYYTISGRKITFVLKDIGLSGIQDENNNWGIITFSLTTNPEHPQRPTVPPRAQIPECMYFDLSIVFINENGLAMAPVTDAALVRLRCFTANFACPRPKKKLPHTH